MTGNRTTPPRDSAPEPISAEQLREILQHHELFAELSDMVVDTLARSAERVFVGAGTEILGKGKVPEAAYFVEHGRVRCDWGLDRPMLGDLGRGDAFGLASVLGQQPMSGDVFALRDTRLIRLPAVELPLAVSRHPELLIAFSRWQRHAALRSHGMGSARGLPNAFSILPLDEDPMVERAEEMLFEAFGRVAGAAKIVDDVRVSQLLGPSASGVDFELAPQGLLDWCEEQEAAGSCLFFAADPRDTAWTRWCLRQTDKVVVVVGADADIDLQALDRRFAGRKLAGSPVQVSLILVHPAGTEVPRATHRWHELSCLRSHHHVRAGEKRDFERAARRLCERGVGVVLGGGGARGFAHIGVLHALEEAGIVVDHIGGTSMGSIMGASYARGWSPTQILEIVAGVFKSSRAVIDLDVPMVAMLSGVRLDRVLRSLFDDLDIGDLWLPFYAISASLTRARMVVHDRGPVWQALRASASLPGVFPPVQTDGHLLVDGGVVNNVPRGAGVRFEHAGALGLGDAAQAYQPVRQAGVLPEHRTDPGRVDHAE
jgi:CRP-like cAMP-binding protein